MKHLFIALALILSTALNSIDVQATETAFHFIQGESDSPPSEPASILRARHAEASLYDIHARVLPYLKTLPELREAFRSSIPVRIDTTLKYKFIGKFDSTEQHNMAKTICGHVNPETGLFVDQPEIWFYQPRLIARAYADALWTCKFKTTANSPGCAKEMSFDTALVPEVVAHEYFHLLTDRYLKQCHGSVIKEIYSHFLAMLFLEKDRIGYGVSSEFYPKVARIRFDRSPRYKGSEELRTEANSPEIVFGARALMHLNKSFKRTGFSLDERKTFFLSSIQFLAASENRVEKLPQVFHAACESVSQFDLCFQNVNQWTQRVYKTKRRKV